MYEFWLTESNESNYLESTVVPTSSFVLPQPPSCFLSEGTLMEHVGQWPGSAPGCLGWLSTSCIGYQPSKPQRQEKVQAHGWEPVCGALAYNPPWDNFALLRGEQYELPERLVPAVVSER